MTEPKRAVKRLRTHGDARPGRVPRSSSLRGSSRVLAVASRYTRRVESPASIALELLEFKLDALVARRPVRGGVAALWRLHGVVESDRGSLVGDERERFTEAARRLRAVAELPTRGSALRANIDDLRLDAGGDDDGMVLDVDTPTTAVADPQLDEERRCLHTLAERVWWDELDEVVVALAPAWRAERDRLTPRIVYATLRNLQRYADDPGAATDTHLQRFKVVEPLPEREDPLISLSDVDSLGELARELLDVVMQIGSGNGIIPGLEVPAAGALTYIRQALLTVARDPYAGRFSLLARKGPSSAELRTALQELSKERLPEAQKAVQRRDLDARLAETLAFERHQREMFQRDALRCVEHVNALVERLERHLPARVGGRAPGPRLMGGVLFAVNPALRWERVPPGAEAFTLRMVGPARFTIGGQEIALMGSGATRTLYADGTSHPLAPHMELRVGRGRVLADVEGDYLYLRFRDEGRSLANRVAEALVAAFVLTHERSADLMTIAAGIAGARSATPFETVRRAITQAGEITARAPRRRAALEGLVRGSANAASVSLPDNIIHALTERLATALSVEPSDLLGLIEREDGVEGQVYPLTSEPLTVDVAGAKLTVRGYRGRARGAEQLVVMVPGFVIGAFSDVLVEGLAGGTLICARAEQELAVLYLRDRPITLPSDHAT